MQVQLLICEQRGHYGTLQSRITCFYVRRSSGLPENLHLRNPFIFRQLDFVDFVDFVDFDF